MPYIYIYIVLSYTLVLGLSPFRLMRWKTKEEGEKKKTPMFFAPSTGKESKALRKFRNVSSFGCHVL